jgi:hypothetical protein
MSRAKSGKARTSDRERPSNAQRDGRAGGKQTKTESETLQGSKGVATPKAQDDETKPYKPTPAEAETLKAYRASRTNRGPRLKVVVTGPNAVDIGVHHPDNAIGAVALMHAIGTTDFDFYNGLIGQLVNASKEKEASESGTNFMLSVIKGIEPKDQIETMLAAQMAAVHMASMTFARRLAHVDTIPQQDSASNAFNKLTRTFASQVEALKRYRSGGEQKMTVQHVHVAEGGQAIVGNVSASTEGVGARKKTEVQPHALGYAPGVEMPRQVEKERETMPSTSGAGP